MASARTRGKLQGPFCELPTTRPHLRATVPPPPGEHGVFSHLVTRVYLAANKGNSVWGCHATQRQYRWTPGCPGTWQSYLITAPTLAVGPRGWWVAGETQVLVLSLAWEGPTRPISWTPLYRQAVAKATRALAEGLESPHCDQVSFCHRWNSPLLF